VPLAMPWLGSAVMTAGFSHVNLSYPVPLAMPKLL